jgi:hypothetical protein
MDHMLLTKKFFRDNPYMENSVQRLVYSTLLYEGLEQAAAEMVLERAGISGDRLERITRERGIILAESDPEMIFQLLRKNLDVINRTTLIQKALEFEEEILPIVVEKLVRNNHETFIENAIRLLARSKEDYSRQLLDRYNEFRSPYVQSLFCLILGFRGTEDVIPWMMDRFFEMRKLYPDETYDQGPLLALHELKARFYSK